jgi:hypothetical protein
MSNQSSLRHAIRPDSVFQYPNASDIQLASKVSYCGKRMSGLVQSDLQPSDRLGGLRAVGRIYFEPILLIDAFSDVLDRSVNEGRRE